MLFGPQVLFRGQPHGTFKFVFNGIVQSVVAEKRAEQGRLTPPSNEGIQGVLVLPGRGPLPANVVDRFITEAGGDKGKVVLLSLAGRDDGAAATRELKERLAKATASVQVLNGSAFRNGSAEDTAKALDEATGVWLVAAPNGEDAEANSGLAAALKKVVSRGGVLAGEGALAAVDSFDLLPGVKLAAVGPGSEGLEPLRTARGPTAGLLRPRRRGAVGRRREGAEDHRPGRGDRARASGGGRRTAGE